MYADSELLPEEKLQRVGKLVEELRDDFEYINLLPHGEYTGIITPKRSNSWLEQERNATMEQLKVFGRNPENADPIFTPQVFRQRPRDWVKLQTSNCMQGYRDLDAP